MDKAKSIIRFQILGIALAVFFVVTLSYKGGLFTGFENTFEDLLFSPKAVDKSIVILAIDNDSLQKIGQWPWARESFAQILDNLNKYPPKVVGADVIFADPSSRGEGDDLKLAQTLDKISYKMVMPFEAIGIHRNSNGEGWGMDEGVIPRQLFLQSETKSIKLGHVNLITDRDGVVRNVPGVIESKLNDFSGPIKPFAEIIAGHSGYRHEMSVGVSGRRIVYSGVPGSISVVPIYKAFEGDGETLVGLKDKIVLIGSTASDLHDEQPTPMSHGVNMSGVEIQAQIVNMLLKDYRLVDVPEWAMILILLIAVLIPALLFTFVRRTYLAVITCIVVGIIYLPITIILFDTGVVINFIHLALAWIIMTIALFGHRYTTVDKERRQMRHAFSKYVSKDVLHEIMAHPEKVKLGGEDKMATVFFSDVRGFTTLSEGLTPAGLVDFLNRYLSVMTDIVLSKKGVVDKYIGDAIMAFWGAPLDNDDQVIDAINASLNMVDALEELNKKNLAKGEPKIDIGIGLNTGKVTVGNMGSTQRFDYTVMGDTVNLASRLEGQTKSYTIHILISENTLRAAPPEKLEKLGIVVRELDQIKVKGKKLPVRVHQVVDRSMAEKVKEILPKFNDLREAYYKGAWQTCIKLGEEISKQLDDGPTKALVARAQYFIEHPPENWEGVYELKTK